MNNIDENFKYEANRSNLKISFERISFIFFIFFIITIIFTSKTIYLGFKKTNQTQTVKEKEKYRASIMDRNGNIIAKTVRVTNLGINPNQLINKEKLLISLKLIFPDKNFEKEIKGKKFFYVKKKISPSKLEKIKLLGEKSFKEEENIARVYPNGNLFSHILGQIDTDNNGVSGIEKSFDYELTTSNKPLKLSLDTEIQYLIREELVKFQEIFNSYGSTAILMNVNNGEILSMVSLPDFDLNKREDISDKKFINRSTKGVYELGSVFKTFTFAAGLQQNVIQEDTLFKNLPKKIKCAGRSISEYDMDIPSSLTAEEILIRSGNIGSIKIAQKVGLENFKDFLENLDLLNKIQFDIEEVGNPIPFKWGKCKLATSAYGHGITITPLQLAKAYAIIANGGYKIEPTLIKKSKNLKKGEQIITQENSSKINKILRKIVTSEQGTANLANIVGYEIAGKTGTAQKSIKGKYSKKKINTFASIFPISSPKYVLIVLLDEPKLSETYIYEYNDGKKRKIIGTPFNTAGWTSVEVAKNIIEKIGPILAIKY
ncbi:cell division protein FtsI [Pelagibacteraceae bacterium GOM-A1]|nr:cell division protein FtsI [Pelagibacteraceae bacterium GOM-A1]